MLLIKTNHCFLNISLGILSSTIRQETEIRKQKDIQIMAKASGNKELVQESQSRITQLTHKYKELSDISGLPTKLSRMRVSGYKRTSIAKMK